MSSTKKALAVFLISCSLFAWTASPVLAAPGDRPGAMAMVVDVPLRVLSLGLSFVTSAVFVVALPFAFTSGSTESAWDTLVAEPFEFTFTRPLGQFDDWREKN